MKKRMTDEELAAEAARWTSRERDPKMWIDSPEAIPRASESVSISLRMPRLMLEILREFARRRGIGYQVLMKRWLDDRIRDERNALLERARTVDLQRPTILKQAASYVPPDDIAIDGKSQC